MTDLEATIQIARGDRPAELVLKNARVVNVFSHEILPCDVAIHDEHVVGLGAYDGEREIDLAGSLACPGFIDGHIHVESSMVTIPEFTRAVLPLGTTSLVIDPHEIANVMGVEGINYMLKTSKYNPMNTYVMLPSCVPATRLETAGAELKAIDLLPLFVNKWVLGIGEMMNYVGVLAGDEDVLEKIKVASDKIIDGHAPGLAGRDLCAYLACGIRSDHECTDVEEAREKLRMGMHIMIREGSTTRDLRALIPMVTPENHSRISFCTDDRSPMDLLERGHIDGMIRASIGEGLDPIIAIKMATINTAQYFRLQNTGAVAPGYWADLVVVDDLRDFRIRKVFKNGELVAEDGRVLRERPPPSRLRLRKSVNIKWLEDDDFSIPALGRRVRVIGTVPGQIITRALVEDAPIRDGQVVADPDRDLLKLVVIERHTGSDQIGKGLIHGLGLRGGAMASTVAHDSHNLIVAGDNDRDMFAAAVHLNKTHGGQVLVRDGEVVAELALPIAGLMSDEPLEVVRDKVAELVRVARELGCTHPDPFMALAFMCLPVIPELKLTDQGLVDSNRCEFVDLFVE